MEPWGHPDHPIVAHSVAHGAKLSEGASQQEREVVNGPRSFHVRLSSCIPLHFAEGPRQAAGSELLGREVLCGFVDALVHEVAQAVGRSIRDGLCAADRNTSRLTAGSTAEEADGLGGAQQRRDDRAAVRLPGALRALLQPDVGARGQDELDVCGQGAPQRHGLGGGQCVRLLQVRGPQEEEADGVREQVLGQHERSVHEVGARAVLSEDLAQLPLQVPVHVRDRVDKAPGVSGREDVPVVQQVTA
mmetsp:Transcript_41680/g.134760  ORF Transcript_41680/g.134760 Transcript_41680/m.134760 type:complete len:246 (-) Transcript_41680:444-1181(-)